MTTTKTGEQVPLTIDNIKLQVMMKRGDEVNEDVTCDSAFMLDTIPDIAQTMREKFHWILETEKIYLVMDNAGGHGTDAAKETYVNVLKEKNIEVIWQLV